MKATTIAFLLGLLWTDPPAPADGIVIDAEGPGAPVLSAVVNGVPLRLELDLAGPRFLVLNGEAAEEAGLRANRLLPVSAEIEGMKIKGRTGRTGVDIPGLKSFRIRTIWFPGEEYSLIADGKIGIGGLRTDRPITLRLHAGDGETETRTFAGEDGLTWSLEDENGPLPLAVTFDLADGVSTTTAGGMARLAAAGLVTDRMDDVAIEPFELELDKLARREEALGLSPLGLEPLRIRSFLTREDAMRLEERAAWEERFAGQDIFVVSGEVERDAAIPIELGRDALAGCRSLTFDPRTEAVTLRCAAFAGAPPEAAR